MRIRPIAGHLTRRDTLARMQSAFTVAAALGLLAASACEKPTPAQAAAQTSTAFRVKLLDEPGYELFIPRTSAESLSAWLNDDIHLDQMGKLLGCGVSSALDSAGVPQGLSEAGARMLVWLFKSNADAFRASLSSNMGSSGVIVTIKPPQNWIEQHVSQAVGYQWSFDPIKANMNLWTAASRAILKRYGSEESKTLVATWDRQWRELFWVTETPITVFIDPSTWSVRRNDE